MSVTDVVILSGARTPMGSFQGELSGLAAPLLGAAAVREAVKRAGVEPGDIDETVMGCVLPHGLGQAPARQAAVHAGVPFGVPATTVNKMCGSGMKAVMIAADQIAAGRATLVLAGGMESMSNAPYLLPKARAGMRLGHGEVKDSMFLDGLEDAYEHRLMGAYAEDAARHYQFTRAEQDAYATESLKRAKWAQDSGAFEGEIVAVSVPSRAGDVSVRLDEQPKTANPAKIPTLKPAFAKDGTVTAANASGLNDGAAALVLMTAAEAARRGVTPLARIASWATAGVDPALMGTGPIPASRKALEKAGWSKEDLDLVEANEAFAAQACAVNKGLGWDISKVNVNGGAIASGHPIGASGARILVTLLHEMARR
ncbi:MAG TPA: acetyl-CoA C-acyltransferase, partial [Rhizomicrobium sp.]